MSDQVPPDAAERINQRIIDASEVIPAVKSADARNSVFDVPKQKRPRKSGSKHPTTTPTPAAGVPRVFSCAIANDGSLVLMRGGRIELSLSDTDAATLQSYLVKRATANLFASIA
ncbi:hypothetical protein [Paraburkholderia phosphatilytica]|uniref:hypothetical protein n=1 Tax=Paraburkholderia phosphatilytica TaxID=2282883 RepID=UPI000F5EB044|nr:hypothetical protein [Paraburkholderia phosphatilytica]